MLINFQLIDFECGELMSEVKKIRSSFGKKINVFDRIREKDEVFALFYANWCGFSRRFLPIFDEFSENNPDICLSIEISEDPLICEKYSIKYYPTVILFEKGNVKKRLDSKPGIGLNKKQLQELSKKE